MLGLKLWVVAPLVAVLLLLAWRRASMLSWAVTWWVAMLVLFKFAFRVPVPQSVVMLYMAIVTGAIFAYVTSNAGRLEGFWGPIRRMVLERQRLPVLVLVVVAIPTLIALNVYARMSVPLEAPAFGRTVHPAPPNEITVHEHEIDLITADNPYRHIRETDEEAFQAHLANGRRVYFQNCFYCHGDAMAGDGMFAHALNPIPSNFTDQGVLPMLQESFLFWRVSKGAPGLPEEGGPWDSAMPAWEHFLQEEEMWDVILFLYDYTNYSPRALEEAHH